MKYKFIILFATLCLSILGCSSSTFLEHQRITEKKSFDQRWNGKQITEAVEAYGIPEQSIEYSDHDPKDGTLYLFRIQRSVGACLLVFGVKNDEIIFTNIKRLKKGDMRAISCFD